MTEPTEVITIDAADVEFVDTEVVLPVELDRAVSTAKAHPRSIEEVRKELGALATLDSASAREMFYGLKRSGKRIEGPSIRFAEALKFAWKNLRTYGRVVEVGATTLVAEGYAWDLERNTAIGKRVTRRITKRDGSRYSEDMIAVAGNAAVSIAIRNAILSVVPRAIWREAFEASLQVAVGDRKDMKSHRQQWLLWWNEQGGTESQLWQFLDIKGPDDIGPFEMRTLHGLRTAVDEQMTTFTREIEIVLGKETVEEQTAAFDTAVMGGEDG